MPLQKMWGCNSMDVSQYLEIFIDETKEHLQSLNEQLLILEKEPENVETINEIFRAAHSLKGMAGTMGYKRMQRLTHDMENVFSEIRNGKMKVSAALVDVLFRGLDALESYLEIIQSTSDEGTEDNEIIIKDLNDNYFMIDFEFAANNYALYDVACFGNDNVNDGVLLLKEYKNGSPSLLDYKRFYLWRIFISLQWYNVALIKHYRGEGDAHKINFLKVSEHFLSNAKEAYSLFHKS